MRGLTEAPLDMYNSTGNLHFLLIINNIIVKDSIWKVILKCRKINKELFSLVVNIKYTHSHMSHVEWLKF